MSLRVVLVRPETPANVGAVARAIRNTGLSGLDLVAPGDWRTVECWRTAWGAQAVLEQARVFPDLALALADATWVCGFSRRPEGEVAWDVRAAAAEMATLTGSERVALVFGPETLGLTQDELALCGRQASIPSHPDQPSLNLSHAVMVAAYEVFRAGHVPQAPVPQVTHADKERLLALLTAGLLGLRAASPPRRQVYVRLWRTFIQRAPLAPRELRGLMHFARRLVAQTASRGEDA